MRPRVALGWILFLAAASCVAAGTPLQIVWPTPNPAWAEGKPVDDYIQPTVSGRPESGLYGCAREDGGRFHEGIDLKPVSRDARGEPTDSVFAAMAGVVAYINPRAEDSNYGRYVVLVHPGAQPEIYTLYAHLAKIAPGLKVGAAVVCGQAIATMGHTSDDNDIPTSRAHLHFEMGVMVTLDFQRWYDRQNFGSPNPHGLFNGMNLMGFDPLDFLNKHRTHRVSGFTDYFAQMTPAARVRVATRQVPDFVKRYPALLTKSVPSSGVAGWDIEVDWTGIPFSWTPLAAADVAGWRPGEVRLSQVDASILASRRCKSVAAPRVGGGYAPGKTLDILIQQIFGLE